MVKFSNHCTGTHAKSNRPQEHVSENGEVLKGVILKGVILKGVIPKGVIPKGVIPKGVMRKGVILKDVNSMKNIENRNINIS